MGGEVAAEAREWAGGEVGVTEGEDEIGENEGGSEGFPAEEEG